ncbi:hypothetical protein PUR29_34805 [Methylobacterium ajmalii]|uniref:Uncharacterized protein n=1 Tax=Methylobacterium ajmalii TaxID=2738439 RepID=A0ABV0A4T0_9HYPH
MSDKVYVAIYEHREGEEVSVHKTEAGAAALKDDIAERWWDTELKGRPMPLNAIGEAYFHIMGERGEEFFSVHPCEVAE